jgi:hypothetical protein
MAGMGLCSVQVGQNLRAFDLFEIIIDQYSFHFLSISATNVDQGQNLQGFYMLDM